MTYRIRIFDAKGSCVEGGFATLEEAAQRQDVLRATYAAHPDMGMLTVLETYAPTRPVRDKVRELLDRVRCQVGETDPILRIAAGLEPTPLLDIYDALVESVAMLSQLVYDEEGKC